MKKGLLFLAICFLLFVASCGNKKDNVDEAVKLGGSCSVSGEESCSADGAEILFCKNSTWHTKEMCNLNFGQYCRKSADDSYTCAAPENDNDKSDDSDNINNDSLPDKSMHEDDEMSDSNDDSVYDDEDESDYDNDSDDSVSDSDGDSMNENDIEIGATRSADCTDLPANATWNTVASITQTWNGEEWIPSTTATFSTTSSTTKCRFICKDNYSWNDSECVAETKSANCEGLPENAEWNSVSSITQTWDGEEWIPSSIGNYNPNSSSSECRFKCNEHYSWKNSQCVADTQLANCTGLPANAEWNSVSSITQTWDGSGWMPVTVGIYSITAGTDECRFKCKTNFIWNSSSSKCVAATQEANCIELPANAEWNTATSVSQVWDGNEWIPTNVGSFNTSASQSECYFKCKEHYTWNGTLCNADTQPVNCTGLPANASWNSVSSITQTWNGSDWEPSNIGSFNTAASIFECRFKCDENYSWDIETSTCKADSRPAKCNELPANASWNNASSITQTWNGSEWIPSTVGYYNTTASSEECRFKCNEHYNWKNSQCVADNQSANCIGLPANASWNNASSITQTWNGSEWMPTNVGSYNTMASSEECRFKCNEHYNWQDSQCIAETQPAKCIGLPANAEWNTASSITQTWNGSDWIPSAIGTYNTVSSTEECRFKCNSDYHWENSECVSNTKKNAACVGLPANASWNTASVINQNWTISNGWQPSTTGVYNTVASSEECRFKCNEHYNWNIYDSKCSPETQQGNCSGNLPEYAVWNDNGANGKFTQTWSSSGWTPATYASSYSETAGICKYKCDKNYSWNNSKCDAAQTQQVNCIGLPDNAEWNTVSRITQTWDNYLGLWVPSNTGSYNTEGSDSQCRFKCKSGFTWKNSMCLGVGSTRTADCTGLPDFAQWNFATSITQTYNGYSWSPSTNGTYNSTGSYTACYFKCFDDYTYTYIDSYNGSICLGEGSKKTANCTDLPDHAQWNTVSSITQTLHKYAQYDMWGNEEGYTYRWEPDLFAIYNTTPSLSECRYICESSYDYDGNGKCVKIGDTQTAYCTTLPDENATYNTASNITQTWNGSAWTPSNVSVYNTVASTTQCRFKCNSGYSYNNSNCRSTNQRNLGVICTGQTSCYNNSESLTCPASSSADFFGQDAQYHMCSPNSFVSKSVSDQGIIEDLNTWLMWQKSVPSDKYTWENAVSYCDGSTYAGYTDWRLPTPQELLTIINNGKYGSALALYGVSVSSDTRLWSSKKRGTSNNVFILNPYYGSITSVDSAQEANTYNIICVRGNTLPVSSFTESTVSGKVVVKDSNTGLVWQKTYSADKTWQQALKECEDSTYAGYSDWRLPNKNELASLLNYNKTAAPYSGFSGMPSKIFWSSTTLDASTTSVWSIDFETALVGSSGKTDTYYVRCVRNAN